MSWRHYTEGRSTSAPVLTDYSQDHEQEHILDAVKGIGRGKFLDIGAFHPMELSNTRALYELGWEGVMVEPSPAPMLTLLKEYGNDPRIKLIQAVVVPETEGSLKSMRITDGPYSTVDAANFTKWQFAGGFYGSMFVPVLPVEALLTWFGSFDFISVDVEGGSRELFERILALKARPKCMSVEYDERLKEVQASARESGYEQVFVNAVNIIFQSV